MPGIGCAKGEYTVVHVILILFNSRREAQRKTLLSALNSPEIKSEKLENAELAYSIYYLLSSHAKEVVKNHMYSATYLSCDQSL